MLCSFLFYDLFRVCKGVLKAEDDCDIIFTLDVDMIDQLEQEGTGEIFDIAVLFEVFDKRVCFDTCFGIVG